MASSSSTKKKVVLKCLDGNQFEVDEAVALKSQTIKQLFGDNCAGNIIPVPNVTTPALSKVIEYCKRHVSDEKASFEEKYELRTFDEDFVKLDRPTLFDLVKAANYLDIKGLLDLMCQAVANMIKGMPLEDIRNLFNIENPEEEEPVRKENEWALQ